MRITKPLMCCSGDKARKTRALVNLKRPRGVRIIKSSLPLKYDTSLEDSQTSGSLTFGVTSSRLLWWEVCWLPDSPKTALSFDVLPKMRHIKYFPCTKTFFFLKLGGKSFPEVFAHKQCQQLSGRLQCVNAHRARDFTYAPHMPTEVSRAPETTNPPPDSLQHQHNKHTHYPADWLFVIIKNWHEA